MTFGTDVSPLMVTKVDQTMVNGSKTPDVDAFSGIITKDGEMK